jgi:hypothetical protein
MRKATLFRSIARYCSELAPIAGPVLLSAADLAGALERAALPAATPPSTPVILPEDD